LIVETLIKAAFRKIGVLSSGESPETDRLDESLKALQSMLRSWAQNHILIFASSEESFVLTAGKTSYTWGIGGDINTIRPYQILSAFIRDSNGTDIPVRIISEGEYGRISSKTSIGRPTLLFYHPDYPFGKIYVYSTPNTVETMLFKTLKPFTETSSFSSVNDTLSFPPNYEEALIYGLAIRIAPEYGVRMSNEAVAIANDSFDSVIGLNSQNQIEPIRLDNELPIGNRGGFNINSG